MPFLFHHTRTGGETMGYQVCFKFDPCERFPGGYSDHFGIDFTTIQGAINHIAEIQAAPYPEAVNLLQIPDSMWVVDECGSICY
jgi:hypothetical protein